TYNELLNGTCKANTLIYVRGPMEPGNTGNFGMGLIPVIQSMIPNLAVQGLNYPAGLMSTTRPYGAFPADMTSLTTTINSAVSKCPNTTILLSGWSLGTAVIRGSLKQLLSTPSGKEIVDKKIGGILLFGDTQYAQSNKTVEGLGGAEAGKFRIFCNGNDAVCGGQLTINQGHIDYMD
ncbi:alpha/beta-hydrolase, partial [Tothia fuscella]